MKNDDLTQNSDTGRQWKNIYILGGIMTLLALAGILLDVFIGNVTGGDLTALPQTAIGRFEQFQSNAFLGLYNLDFLNIVNQIILIPVYIALFAVHRNTNVGYVTISD